MKRYRVEIALSAEREIAEAYSYAASRAPLNAQRWYNRLIDALQSLAMIPNGYPLAPESRHAAEQVRQFLFGKKPNYWRVLFIVRANTVVVIHFRRGVRTRMALDELIIPVDPSE